MRWGRRWGILLGALLVLPLVVWSVSWILHGWIPEGDEGWIALKVHDVFTAHPPVQAMPSTSNRSWPGTWAHHPGPMQFYLLAVPYAVTGYHPAGLVLGGLLLSIASIVLAMWHGWQAGRRAGLTAVVVAIIVSELLIGPSLVLPWNPWPPVLGTVALLVLVWRLLLGHTRVLPWFAAVCSLVLQANLALVANLFPLLVVLGGVGLIAWHRSRGSAWPLPGWRPRNQPPVWRRPGVVALAVGGLCWTPSIVELFVISPNNASQLWAIVAVELHGPLHIVGAIVLVAACGWAAHAITMRPALSRADAVHWISWLVAAGVLLSIVASSGQRLIYLVMMIGGVSFAIAVWPRWGPVVWRARVFPPVAWLVVAAVVAWGVGPGAPAAPIFTRFWLEDIQRAEPVTHEAVHALRAHGVRSGPVVVHADGFRAGSSYGTAVVVVLVVNGYTPYFDSAWPLQQDDDFRRIRNAPADAVQLTVRDDKPPLVKVPARR